MTIDNRYHFCDNCGPIGYAEIYPTWMENGRPYPKPHCPECHGMVELDVERIERERGLSLAPSTRTNDHG